MTEAPTWSGTDTATAHSVGALNHWDVIGSANTDLDIESKLKHSFFVQTVQLSSTLISRQGQSSLGVLSSKHILYKYPLLGQPVDL